VSKPSLPQIVARLRVAGCVFAEDEAELLVAEAGSPGELAVLVDRRVAGEPLEYVLGWAEFSGLRVLVDPGVFVPRRRTELLVREAAASARPGAVVLDLCCGSGALGVALASLVPDVELYAADVDPVAVECARRNVGEAGTVYLGDLYEPLPADLYGRVDVLFANVPYVPSEEVALMPPEARVHEPQTALDGGGDGLDVLRRVAAGAPRWLAPDGLLLFETGGRQAEAAVDAVQEQGLLRARVVWSEDLDATAVVATR
jgi:release factor glutamine methyltransferase